MTLWRDEYDPSMSVVGRDGRDVPILGGVDTWNI